MGNEYPVVSFEQGFENGMVPWIASGNYPEAYGTVQNRGWTPETTGFDARVEGRLGAQFFQIQAGADQVGYGQVVDIGDNFGRHVLACQGYKDGGWAAFGITYYDSSFNELAIFRKQFGPRSEFRTIFSRGNGDGMNPYSLGCAVPPGAAFAYIWIWQEESAGTPLCVDEFTLMNFANGDPGNILINGDFETGNSNDVLANDPTKATAYLSGREFWETNGDDGSIVFSNTIADGQFLRMGDNSGEDLIYQQVLLNPGQSYTIRTEFLRSLAQVRPYAIAGVDFFDANATKIGDSVYLEMESLARPGPSEPLPGAQTTFTAPSATAFAYVWVWVETYDVGDLEPTLFLHSIRLTESNPQ